MAAAPGDDAGAAAAAAAPPPPPPTADAADAYVATVPCPRDDGTTADVVIARYTGGDQLRQIMALMSAELSEPYSIFTFRHFLEGWPHLCFVAHDRASGRLVGAIVNKAELRQRTQRVRGYVAMLAVERPYRRGGLGRRLAATGLQAMCMECDEVLLETEECNTAALRLYERLGFVRDKRLPRYYLNNNDAFRLKAVLR